MSSPLAGKFQDHYQVLGIDPKADSDTMQRAYANLAKKYHPDTPETGNREEFDAVNLAYEILSDGVMRREFDKVKGVDERDEPKFAGYEFFDALARTTGLRAAVLCVLYDRRRSRPFTPSLSMRHMEGMIEATQDELNFALWYLKQRSLAASDDKSSLQITVDGIDYVDRARPLPDAVLPFVKAAALAGPTDRRETAPATMFHEEASAVPSEHESGMDGLRRALKEVLAAG